MSYTLDLLRLPKEVPPEEAYKKKAEEKEMKLLQSMSDGDPGTIDPAKEDVKKRLSAALMARCPSLKVFQPDYAALAKSHSISPAEAERRFRDVELNEERYGIQIILFDDAAGASLSSSESTQDCITALRLLWDCLEVLESDGGFSTYDPQVSKILNLRSDFDLVQNTACGGNRDKNGAPA